MEKGLIYTIIIITSLYLSMNNINNKENLVLFLFREHINSLRHAL